MISIKRFILALSMFCVFCQGSKGQDEEFLQGMFFLSPDLGLMVGTTTRIEVSPTLGYYLNDRLCLAGGFIYEYSWTHDALFNDTAVSLCQDVYIIKNNTGYSLSFCSDEKDRLSLENTYAEMWRSLSVK